jgi:hypothetical protein
MKLETTCRVSDDGRTRSGLARIKKLLFLALSAALIFGCGESGSGSVPPIADFSVAQVDGTQTLIFTADTDDVDSIEWDFGDDTESPDVTNPDEKSPEETTHHTFCRAGEYDVRLTMEGAGGEDTVVKKVVVDPIPGTGGGVSPCDRTERRFTIWVDMQLDGGGEDGCLGADRVPVPLADALNYGQEISWTAVSSPCECIGIEAARGPSDSAATDPECMQFIHVGPDGEVTGRGENEHKFVLGQDDVLRNTCGTDRKESDKHHNTFGLHSITATPYSGDAEEFGDDCTGVPMGASRVGQYSIVE